MQIGTLKQEKQEALSSLINLEIAGAGSRVYTSNVSNYTLCILLLAACCPAFVAAYRSPRKVLQVPFAIGLATVLYLLPQALSLAGDVTTPDLLEFDKRFHPSSTTLSLLLGICIAINLSVFLGDRLPRKSIVRFFARVQPKSDRRLYFAGVLLVAISFTANLFIWWTAQGDLRFFGEPELFRNGMYLGLSIMLWGYLTSPKKTTLFLLIFACITPFSLIVFFAKREVAARFLYAAFVGVFFWKKQALKRSSLCIGFIALFLFLNLSGSYRECLLSEHCRFRSTDFVQVLVSPFHGNRALELREAGHLIEYLRETGSYEYGRGYTDHAIYSLLPETIVGTAQKKALLSNSFQETYRAYREWSPSASRGVSWSGAGDTFLQFSYAGFLVFFLIAMFMRSLWVSAQQNGHLTSQLLYIQLLPSAVRGVLHGSYVFTTDTLFTALVLGIVLLVSGARKMQRRHSTR